MLGCQCANVCHNVRTEKEGITVNTQNINQAIDIQVIFILENKLQKEHLSNSDHFFQELISIHFKPLLGWECAFELKKKACTLKSEHMKKAIGI